MTSATTDGAALAVKTTELTKRFGERRALDGVDLEVPAVSQSVLSGPNGAGKTTIIRLLLGLARPTSGSVSVLGHAVPQDRAEAPGRVAAIVEEPQFYPFLTGRENLEVNAAARGGTTVTRIPEVHERVGLSSRARERVSGYSLDMRQRLGIARCPLANPELLFLDEPMNGLDPAGMLEFRGLIRELVGEGRTVFLSSHLLDKVQRTCDFAAIVDRGKVVTQGSLDALTASANGSPSGRTTRTCGGAARQPARRGSRRCRGWRREGVVAPNVVRDRELVTEIVRRMLDAGLAIDRVTPVEASLEERFLNITHGLEE